MSKYTISITLSKGVFLTVCFISRISLAFHNQGLIRKNIIFDSILVSYTLNYIIFSYPSRPPHVPFQIQYDKMDTSSE